MQWPLESLSRHRCVAFLTANSAQKDDPLRNVQAHSPHFFNSIKGDEGISTLRVLDGEGHVLDETDAGSKEIIDAIDREKAQRMYRAMTLTVR